MRYARLLCTLLITFCAVGAHAQWVKGNTYAGIRVGLGPKESGLLVGVDGEMALTKGNDTYGPGSIGAGVSLDYTGYSKDLPQTTYQRTLIFFSVYGAYHFSPSMDDKRLDPYILIGLAPYYDKVTTESKTIGIIGGTDSQIDVAFVGALGMRYFFSPQLAGHVRLGFGSSFVSVGVTATI